MDSILEFLGAFWLGGSLSYFGKIDYTNWRFYVIVIPFFVLYYLSDYI